MMVCRHKWVTVTDETFGPNDTIVRSDSFLFCDLCGATLNNGEPMTNRSAQTAAAMLVLVALVAGVALYYRSTKGKREAQAPNGEETTQEPIAVRRRRRRSETSTEGQSQDTKESLPSEHSETPPREDASSSTDDSESSSGDQTA